METLQPPKQPVLLLSHSHSKKKKSFLTFVEKFPCSHLCHCLWTCQLWRVLEGRDKNFCFTQYLISLYVLTCMQIKSPGDARCSWFLMSASLKQVGPFSKTKAHKLNTRSIPLSLSVAFDQLWKIHCVLPCRALAVLEMGSGVAAGPCVL